MSRAARPEPVQRIRATLDRLAGDLPALGLAVSGGGDSIAMMHVVADWAQGRRVMVATVDHGLRAESADEARLVGRAARDLGLGHATLLWRRHTPEGNLMAQARDARLRLLAGWATRNDLPAVLLGHTRDDLAETLLMRLARGSGIDGLAAMAEWRDRFDVRWLRPLLGVGRSELRDWLRDRDIAWVDDPSNDDPDYERVRARRLMVQMGLDPAALARAAGHIGEARDALSHYALLAARDVRVGRATLGLHRGDFRDAPHEIRRRLLVAGCRWITGGDYPPRRATLLHALDGVNAGARVTLDGTLIEPRGDEIRLGREPAAAFRAAEARDGVWDDRWQVTGLRAGERVAAVGYDALTQLPWRGLGLTRDEAAATPAIRDGTDLIAAPVLRHTRGYAAEPLRGAADFRRLVMAH